MTLPIPDPAFHWNHEAWGSGLRCRSLSAQAQHLFTSKQLPLPDPSAWHAALASVGTSVNSLRRVTQVHGRVVRVLKRGQVPHHAAEDRPDGDAVVSDQPGLSLAVMVADCVPILIADARVGAAAAVHAGWRGTCLRLAAVAVETMRRECGSRPADLTAAIGPSAGPADYEVSESLIEAFRAAGHEAADIDAWFIRTRPKPHLDLWTANRDQLVKSGLSRDRIYICGLSTVSHPAVFDSYRVDGERAGRMAGIIVVPAPAEASAIAEATADKTAD